MKSSISANIFVFSVGIMLGSFFSHNKYSADTDIEYIRDTTIISSIDYIPLPYQTIERDTFFIVDTVEIFKEYFSYRYYQDTLINDTSLTVIVKDSITENKIFSRSFDIEKRDLTQIIHTNNTKKFNFGAGGYINASANQINDYGMGCIINYNKNTLNVCYSMQLRGVNVGYYRYF